MGNIKLTFSTEPHHVKQVFHKVYYVTSRDTYSGIFLPGLWLACYRNVSESSGEQFQKQCTSLQ
jgi:hypothetical protein